MVRVEAADEVEVVSYEHKQKGPLEVARSIHAKDEHDDEELEEEGRLQNAVVAEEADCVVVLVHVLEVSHDVLGCRVDSKSFLKAVIHQWEVGQQKILLRRQVSVNAIGLEVPFRRFKVHELGVELA